MKHNRINQKIEKVHLAITTKEEHIASKETILLVSIVERMGTRCISVGKGWMLNSVCATNSGIIQLSARTNGSSKTQMSRFLMNKNMIYSLWHPVLQTLFQLGLAD